MERVSFFFSDGRNPCRNRYDSSAFYAGFQYLTVRENVALGLKSSRQPFLDLKYCRKEDDGDL